MRKIFILLLSIFWISGFSQLDTDHWFAPMASRAGTNGIESYLYLSTNEVTPFTVSIYNNNTLFTTVQVSKGNPQQVFIPGYFMMASQQGDLFTAVPMGMFVKGSKKFFANYRFSVTNHAEIITSKGLAGLGTEFHVAMAANTAQVSYVNSTIGFVATEDNTTVTVSGYDAGIIFSDGVSTPTRTFTIDRGESYIMDVLSTTSTSNMNGLIGAKVVSNHPISMTNGNFNGIYTNQNFTNNDILMDQSVPVDRLGDQFIVVKGNGSTTSEMEQLLVVATENNTTLTVNGTPLGIVLNEGDYTLIPGTNYINQGNNHYNMSLSSTENVYVYQLLGGTNSGNVYAVGGFNYIPPLNCFLPNKVDEVGFIDQIGSASYNTKLNIITEVGANVTLNNAPIAAANGPYPVLGNPNWVTYSVPNVSGTVTVNSNKSVTAGIAAGSGAVGYGGYFAGFSSIPVIVKTGDCFSGILLQVDDSYDAYQWFLNGNPIPGATTYFINPELYGAGQYTIQITKINCGSKTTEIYNYTLCPPITITTYNIGSCQTQIINPAFTNSTQTINPALTDLVLAPTNGTVNINATTGQITYTPNAGLTADVTDTFVYYVEGNGNPADFEYFRVNLNIDVLQTTNFSLSSCSNDAGNGTFNLASQSSSPDAGTTVLYFSNAGLTNQINNFNNYSSPAGTVYAQVTSSFGCTKTAQITLNVIQSPNINTSNFDGELCDDNFDGTIPVTFSTITPQIVNNSNLFNIQYYLVQADANAGNANNLPNNWSYNATTTVYIRVEDPAGNCPPAFGQITFSFGAQINLTSSNASAQVCDNDLTGSEQVNLNSYKNLFTADPNVTLSFHNSLADAQNDVNAVSNTQNISIPVTYYVRFESPNACPTTGILHLSLKSPKESTVLVDKEICDGTLTSLDAGPDFDSYLWSTGATTQNINVGIGSYYVDLGFNGCVYRQYVEVTAVEIPVINSVEINGNTATINVSGGTIPYQYSIDGLNYQLSNVFSGLPKGPYTVYVIDANNCNPITQEFYILNLINAITPNGDGYNDVLDYSDLRAKQDVSLEVYDRYGKILFKSSKGNYIWDGKVNGNPISTGTYWYVIKWTEPATKKPAVFSSWILVKNKKGE